MELGLLSLACRLDLQQSTLAHLNTMTSSSPKLVPMGPLHGIYHDSCFLPVAIRGLYVLETDETQFT
jgi:hypothetical protein